MIQYKFNLLQILYRHEDPHGTGDVFFVWQNGGSANLLASTGSDGTVIIFNRQGQVEERIGLHGYEMFIWLIRCLRSTIYVIISRRLCCGFAWDFEGDNLGIITSNSSQVLVVI